MDFVALPPDGTGTLGSSIELGIGPAEMFVAAALVYTLAFVYLLDAAGLESDHQRAIRGTLVAAVVPLLFTFGAVVLYTSITVI